MIGGLEIHTLTAHMMANAPLARAATEPKRGRDPGENDDRAVAGTRSRFALADGASTAARPEEWAQILVYAYVVEGVEVFDPVVLEELRCAWRQRVQAEDLPWYAVAKLQSGGAATFVGIDVDVDQRRYRAVAIGDACLLHIRDGRVLLSGPVVNPAQFGRTPPLITTIAGDHSHRLGLWERDGGYESGDDLVLASDAVAKHLLTRYRDGIAIDPAAIPTDTEGFREWVHTARRDGMDNDDATICLVRP